MHTNHQKLLLKDKVFQILGCATEVLNALGLGLIEKPYENALVVEFSLQKILFQQRPAFDIRYKGDKVGLVVPDLIAFGSVVVDAKVIERITDHERGLMLNYLPTTKLRAGVILNFKRSKIEWERLVLNLCPFVFVCDSHEA